MGNREQFSGLWAVILGGSSGFGFASAEKLAAEGMNIAVFYRETAVAERSLLEKFTAIASAAGVRVLTYNTNALSETAREEFVKDFREKGGDPQSVKLLLHSIARGNLKPLAGEHNLLSAEDIQYTTYAMATSLLDWTRSILDAGLFHRDARIIGLTSEGAHQYWDGYAAVSIAKSSLESLATYMAVEFAPKGLKTNIIQAGITATASLKMIPGSDQLIRIGEQRNPLGRITQPADVARVVYLLCTDDSFWINGALIHVDGGEHCR